MANNFIGLSMLVTLISPPGAQVKGTVSGIEPGKSLTLCNVTYPSTGIFKQEYTIRATEIKELTEVIAEDAVPIRAVPSRDVVIMEPKPLEDPAILSVGKRPIPSDRSPMNTLESNSSWEQVTTHETASKRHYNNEKPVTSLTTDISNISLVEKIKEDITHEKLPSENENDVSQSSILDIKSKKRTRRRKNRKDEAHTVRGTFTDSTKAILKSKGWRQTPLLEHNPTFQPFSNLKRKGNCREEEEWGTEDVTDLQELGDFDFAGALAKFDKNRVFDQLQAEDDVADEDRLVSFNVSSRLRSNNYSKKNLLHSENVIDKTKFINTTPKTKTETRNNSTPNVNENQKAFQHNVDNIIHALQFGNKLNNNRRPLDSRPTSRKGTLSSPLAPSRNFSISKKVNTPVFCIMSSGRRCEPVSPLQMLNLENIAINELGLSEMILTENAGRSIADVAFSALSSGGNGLTKANSTLNSTVVVLVGNNKSGMRAVATARHIKNHGFNVILCVIGLEQESELLASLKSQVRIFRNLGGKVVSNVELFQYMRQLEVHVDLIIDGLIGLAISFEELRLGDQSATYELIAWANRSKIAVLSIDIPTGIDPTSGEVGIIDSGPLFVRPKYIVALGAPMKGLFYAMISRHDINAGRDDDHDLGKSTNSNDWQIFVADIGLSEVVWKKAGSKIRRGIEFEENWVQKLCIKQFEE